MGKKGEKKDVFMVFVNSGTRVHGVGSKSVQALTSAQDDLAKMREAWCYTRRADITVALKNKRGHAVNQDLRI